VRRGRRARLSVADERCKVLGSEALELATPLICLSSSKAYPKYCSACSSLFVSWYTSARLYVEHPDVVEALRNERVRVPEALPPDGRGLAVEFLALLELLLPVEHHRQIVGGRRGRRVGTSRAVRTRRGPESGAASGSESSYTTGATTIVAPCRPNAACCGLTATASDAPSTPRGRYPTGAALNRGQGRRVACQKHSTALR